MNTRLLRSFATCALAAGLLVACGGSDDAPGSADVENDSSSDATAAGDAENSGADDATSADPDVYEVTKNQMSSFDEVTMSDGAQLILGVDCDPQTGANLLLGAGTGFTGGPFSAEIEPTIGGRPDLNVQPDGTVYTARQSTLDAPSYTVTYADLDGGITLTFDGCPA